MQTKWYLETLKPTYLFMSLHILLSYFHEFGCVNDILTTQNQIIIITSSAQHYMCIFSICLNNVSLNPRNWNWQQPKDCKVHHKYVIYYTIVQWYLKSEVFIINYNLSDSCFLQIEKIGLVEVLVTHRTSVIDKNYRQLRHAKYRKEPTPLNWLSITKSLALKAYIYKWHYTEWAGCIYIFINISLLHLLLLLPPICVYVNEITKK